MRAVKIGIRGYRYVRSESEEKEIVHVELEGRPKVCPRCGSSNLVGKGRYERKARHLDTFGRSSELRVATSRQQCRGCGRGSGARNRGGKAFTGIMMPGSVPRGWRRPGSWAAQAWSASTRSLRAARRGSA